MKHTKIYHITARFLLAATLLAVSWTSATAAETAVPYARLENDELVFIYDGNMTNNDYPIEIFYNDSSRGWSNSASSIKSVIFTESFANYRPTSTAYWFMGCSSLTTISGLEYLKTDDVTDMQYMFDYCSSLTTLDMSNFKTDNVLNMKHMFQGCSSLRSLDLSGLNTANVRDMSYMFDNTMGVSAALTSINLSGVKTDNVTDMSHMFNGCSSLTSLDVREFKTDKVENMSSMFYGCSSLTTLDVSNFNTESMTNMSEMFSGCSGLTSLDLTHFNTDQVTGLFAMFSGCSGLTTLDLSSFNTASVSDMMYMFQGCISLNKIYVSDTWSTAALSMGRGESMFTGCTSLEGGAGTTYDASHVDYTYARIDGGVNNPGYFTPKGGYVEAPTFTWSADELTMTSGTEDASIYYTIATHLMSGTLSAVPFTEAIVSNYGVSNNVTGSGYLENTSPNDVFLYKDVEFGTLGCTKFEMLFATKSTGRAQVNFILDNKDNEPVFTIDNVDTGSWTTWMKIAADLDATTQAQLRGKHDLYVKFLGSNNYAGNYQYFHFWNPDDPQNSATETSSPTTNVLYTAPVEIKQDVVITAIARKEGMGDSEPTVLDYPYTAWTKLITAINDAQNVIASADGNNNVTDEQLNALDSKISVAQSMYIARTESSAAVTQLATDLTTLAETIRQAVESAAEPYAVLDGTTLTFYYDDQKSARGGVDINNSYISEGSVSPYGTATIAVFDASFANYQPTSTAYWFQKCSSLISIANIENLKTDAVTSMRSMFRGCSSLTSLSVSGFKADNVTDMSGMFYDCSSLTDLDLSSLNTRSVTDIRYMFYGCSGLTSLGLGGFNTENISEMLSVFEGCSSLTSLDLSSFNTQGVTNMTSMFRGCSNLTTIYVGSEWTIADGIESTDMFSGCTKLVGGAGTRFDADHTDVTYARIDSQDNPGYLTELIRKTLTADDYFEWNGMGAGATKKSETPSRLCNYYIGQSVEVPYGDPNVSAYAYADLSAYDRLEITATAGTPRILLNRDAEDGYWNADESQSHQIESTQSGWSSKYFSQSGNVWTVDLKQMVADKGFAHLNAIKGDNWSAVTITKMELVKGIVESTSTEPYAVLDGTTLTFYYDDQKSAKIGMSVGPFTQGSDREWNDKSAEITKVVFDESFANDMTITSTGYWFSGFTQLTAIEGIGYLNTSNVEDMWAMFENCRSLNTVDLTHFDTRNVKTMGFMFSGCENLQKLDVSSFNTANVTHTNAMFANCFSLTSLDLSGFDTKKVENMSDMFLNCTHLTTIFAGSEWSTEVSTGGDNMFGNCTSLVGGAGTKYDENHVNDTYARIDGGTSAPGYFTDKNATSPEPYAVLSNNNTVLTFYYDDQKSARGGMDIGPFAYLEHGFGESQRPWHDVCESIVYAVIDPSMSQYTSLVSTGWWFYGCKNLKSVSGWENLYPLNIVDMWGTFEYCSSLPSDPAAGGPDFSNFYSNSLKRTVAMFHGCTSMTSLDLSALNTSNVTENEGMFEGCSALTTIYVGSGWDMSNATDNWIDNMFSGCTSLVGGAGTRYDANNIGTSYAHIDGGIDNPGYLTELIRKPLTAADYFEWTGMKANATKKSELPYPNCYYILGQSAEIPYGEPDVNPYTYADLSAYDRLEITATGNTPRILLNRDSVGGQWNEDESLSHMIESTQRGWSSKYFSHSGNVWTVDLKQIVADKGFAHLNAIKGDNWSAVTVIKIELVKINSTATAGTATFDRNLGVLTVEGDLTMQQAVEQAGGRQPIAERITSLIWNSSVVLTESDLDGFTNPNMLIYVGNKDKTTLTRNNVVIEGKARKVVLRDVASGNGDFYCPQEFFADSIIYTHNYKQATEIGVSRGWETLALPFDVQTITHEKNGVIAPFGSSASDKHFWLRQLVDEQGLARATKIEANHAYLISMPNNGKYPADYNLAGNVTFATAGVTVPETINRASQITTDNDRIILMPNFVRMDATPYYYVLNVGEARDGHPEGSVFEVNYRTVLPFQAFTYHEGGQHPSRFISLDELMEGTTGIETIEQPQWSGAEQWWSIDGRKLNGKPSQKGVYIRNGKKVVVKATF